MDIGATQRTFVAEPVVSPVPASDAPEPAPAGPAPVDPRVVSTGPEREPVRAR